ncbi:MAG: putative response regulator, NtrC [Ramlibacter sp.]|uniref:sigma-54-dependent transcriptional regulator n=1 Tax=Ramlibacter sp. TaxID=1917967 RepID=UPI002618ADEC|nr:sigma-54 dependent transcriptional regulator [Ramlibacter sp.]MDB5751657.1 putative response regulator, NtrC [Ramlibacter sp.]
MGSALIVDDDPDFCRMMARLVAHHGFDAATAQSLGSARRQIAARPPDVVLLDLELPDGNGMSLLDDPAVRGRSEVILMTGLARLETSIQALRYGAADYLLKPVDASRLGCILARVTRPDLLQAKVAALRDQLARTGAFGALVGRSGRMQLVYELIGRVAQSSIPVLVSGESGTGKELAARTIHGLSRRQPAPFVAVSCGGIGPDALESELFGSENSRAGDAEHAGLLERARGGTLFLDEICDMSAAMQARLLHVLETGSYTPLFSATRRVVDVRLISASNRDLQQAVAAGLFRQDLFYRLNVFPLQLPPLRERMEDLPLLVTHLLREIGRAEGGFKQLAPAALQRLARCHWSGNVRELRNALHQSYVMTPGDEIKHPWLPSDARPAAAVRSHPAQPVAGRTLAQVEKEAVLATLEQHGNHKERTAAALGISIKTLYNRLKEYGAQEPGR